MSTLTKPAATPTPNTIYADSERTTCPACDSLNWQYYTLGDYGFSAGSVTDSITEHGSCLETECAHSWDISPITIDVSADAIPF